MKTIYFSANQKMLNEWTGKLKIRSFNVAYDLESLENEISKDDRSIIIADFDTVAHDINTLISLGKLPKDVIVLEKSPAIPTGKKLIYNGVKAYGNSRMLQHHFDQMFRVVLSGRTWTYPELTAALVSNVNKNSLDKESIKMIKERLTDKEVGIVYLILEGLTNDAIAAKVNTSTRTVKAHISSIFSKLHVNDRVSLILLLK